MYKYIYNIQTEYNYLKLTQAERCLMAKQPQ